MEANDLVLNFYVKNVEHDGERIYFAVVHTLTLISFTVTRRNGVWSCACDRPLCNHINRALLYYNDMLARTKDLKDQLKIRKEMREQPTTKKRMIRLEGE